MLKKPIFEASFDFTMEHYTSSNKENFNFNNDITLKLADIRPYGLWFKQFFPNNSQHFQSASGIFSVNKQAILDNKVEVYLELFKELDDHHNPEAGHYMERSWAALFNRENKLKCIAVNKMV